MFLDNLEITDVLLRHGADVNRLSYMSYSWPKEGTSFHNLEPALITATRHGMKKITRLIFILLRKICESIR